MSVTPLFTGEYTGTAATAATLTNGRAPSLTRHRHVATEFLLEPAETNDESIRPPLSACGLRPGKQWSDYYAHVNSLRKEHPEVQFKTLYFLRHAQGEHNAAEKIFGLEAWNGGEAFNEKYTDPELTEIGRQQCADFVSGLPAALKAGLNPHLIITSPLTRTLDTSARCLQPLYASLPVASCEHARETIGEHTCNKRSAISKVQPRFSQVQFQFIQSDPDPFWPSPRETRDQKLLRAQRLLDFLFTLPETDIVVVSHQGFLTALANVIGRKFDAAEPVANQKSDSDSNETSLAFLHAEGAFETPLIQSRHAEMMPFCVARLPNADSL